MEAALSTVGSGRWVGLTLGRVYAVYPEANMVDVMLFDGSLLKRVQVVSPFASSKEGVYSLPVPRYEKFMLDRENVLDPAKSSESDVIAVIGFLGGSLLRPVVLGFLFPEENEVLCSKFQKGNNDGSMYLWKHRSNVYVRVAKSDDLENPAEVEISHPSGLFIKIGGSVERTEVENYDRDFRKFEWKNPETKKEDPAPYVYIKHPSGSSWKVDPKGNVEEIVSGNVSRTIKGNLTEVIEGDVSRTVKGKETDTVEKEWKRKSNDGISDEAPAISHN